MEDRHNTGREGEDLACRYLRDNGHRILARNYRYGHLELDIISFDGNGIHFVEVKTRRPPLQAMPQEHVGYRKQANLIKAANHYLNTHAPGGALECHFDIIAIVLDKTTTLEYIQNAFIPIFL